MAQSLSPHHVFRSYSYISRQPWGVLRKGNGVFEVKLCPLSAKFISTGPLRHRKTANFGSSNENVSKFYRYDAPSRERKAERRRTKQEWDKLRSKLSAPYFTADSEQVAIPTDVLQSLITEHIEAERVWDAVMLLEKCGSRSTPLPVDKDIMLRLFRNVRQSARVNQTNDSRSLVKRLMRLYRGRLIEGDPKLTAYILMSFRDLEEWDRALSFWEWARRQNQGGTSHGGGHDPRGRMKNQLQNAYLDLPVYGIAIEILALSGKSLQECEELYQEALARFPEDFNAYHLQPGAALASPDEATSHRGTSLGVLGGILTARLHHGDWRQAYLAFDTAIKLHPTQLTSSLLYSISKNRNILETIAISSIFLRGDNTISESLVGRLAAALRNCMLLTRDLEGRSQLFRLAAEFLLTGSPTSEFRNQHIDTLIATLPKLLLPKSQTSTKEMETAATSVCLALLRDNSFLTSNIGSSIEKPIALPNSLQRWDSVASFESNAVTESSEKDHLRVLQKLHSDIQNFIDQRREDRDCSLIHAPSAWMAPFQSSTELSKADANEKFGLVPRAWQQELYDRIVLLKDADSSAPTRGEPSLPPSDAHLPKATTRESVSPEDRYSRHRRPRIEDILSPRAVGLADLRFRNWCSINDLLLVVQAYEAIREQRTNADIDKRDVKRREETEAALKAEYGWSKVSPKVAELSVVIHDLRKAFKQVEPVLDDKQTWVKKIVQLRTVDAGE